MTIYTHSSEFVVIPDRFRGLRVLLIDPEKSSLDHHAYILSQNSYQVTTTPDVATGLSKILNGESYDCVLIDADINNEMVMVDFLHQTFKHQPQLSIFMMASDNIGMRLFKETLQSDAVLCLPKPCSPRDLCNIWKHACRKRISFDGSDHHYSNEENQEFNISKSSDYMVKQSATLNPTLINNNLSSGSSTQEGISNDYAQEHVDETNTMKNVDKGKLPVEEKRINYQLVDDDHYCKKRTETKKRISWTRDLHKKFVEAVDHALGINQKPHPTIILDKMKVPGLTRSQVASHLQKYQEQLKSEKSMIKNPTLTLTERGNSLQVENYVPKLHGQYSTPTDKYASYSLLSSIFQPPMKKLNSVGISYMSIDNIKARLQETPPLPVPQPATTINSSDSDKSTDHSLHHIYQTSMGKNKITAYGLVENSNSSSGQRNEVQITGNGYGAPKWPLENIVVEAPALSPVDAASFSNNGFVKENWSGATSLMTPLDYSGVAIEPLSVGDFEVGGENSNLFGMNTSAGSGGTSANSSNQNDPENLSFPNFVSGNLDFQGNGENLFPTFPLTTTPDDFEYSINPNFFDSDIPFGVESVSMEGFEAMDSDLFSKYWNECHLEMTVNLLDELDDANLINGPW